MVSCSICWFGCYDLLRVACQRGRHSFMPAGLDGGGIARRNERSWFHGGILRAPGVDSPQKRPDARKTLALEQAGNAGAADLVGAGTINHDIPVPREIVGMMLYLIQGDMNRSAD